MVRANTAPLKRKGNFRGRPHPQKQSPAAGGSARGAKAKGHAGSATFRKSKSLPDVSQDFLNILLKKIDAGTLYTAVYDGTRRIGSVVDRGDCFIALVLVNGGLRPLASFATQKEAARAVSIADRSIAMGQALTGALQ